MALIEVFLKEIDSGWKPIGEEPITLQIIGSAALMLQTRYERGTKDSDILESRDGSPKIKAQLLTLAGKDTDIYKRLHLYVDIVNRAILFLPQSPLFHPLPRIELKNFRVEVLDIVDIALSKLKRFNSDDANDIRAMADKKLIDHPRLVSRFQAAADWFSIDARAPDLARYLKNLNKVEREILAVPPSEIELPEFE